MSYLEKINKCPNCNCDTGKKYNLVKVIFLNTDKTFQCESCGKWLVFNVNALIVLIDTFFIMMAIAFFLALAFVSLSWGSIGQFFIYTFISVLLLLFRAFLYSHSRLEVSVNQ